MAGRARPASADGRQGDERPPATEPVPGGGDHQRGDGGARETEPHHEADLGEVQREAPVALEHPRLGLLRQAVGPDHRIEQVDRDLNVKFVLVTID